MRTIVLIDLPANTKIPRCVVGNQGSAVNIPQGKIRGPLGHPSSILGQLELCEFAPHLVVYSRDPVPNVALSIEQWGYGWRCGRDLENQWMHVALKEGRLKTLVWKHIDGDLVTTSVFGDVDACEHLALSHLGDLILAEGADLWICRDRTRPISRLRDAGRPLFDASLPVWHSSPVGGVTTLKPRGGKLWVSTSAAFASCFAARPYSNLGYFQGVDRVAKNSPTVYLVVPAGGEALLNDPCNLYQTHVSSLEVRQAGVSGYEMVIYNEAKVELSKVFGSCREALDHYEVELLTLADSGPPDAKLEILCMPYRQALEALLQLPLQVALRLRCKRWAIATFIVARRIESITTLTIRQLRAIIERWWLPLVGEECGLAERGYHSIEHLVETALIAAHIARQEGANPILAALAGLLHDSARIGDEEGTDHAERAVLVLERLFGRTAPLLFSREDLVRLRSSITDHASGQTTVDPNIGACWDADRLRLAWERGVDAKFFSTQAGLKMAESNQVEVSAHLNNEYQLSDKLMQTYADW